MANNTIGWGQGATNNNIGWGRGSSNDIGWGSVYDSSYVGDTDIIGGDTRFIITVKTDNAGTSASNQFTLPWIGTYDVEWGDGSSDVGVSGTQTHTYASAGTYDVAVTAASGQIYFNGVDDKAKLIEIKNWGAIQWTTMSRAFFDCNKLTTVSATDSPNLSAVSTLQLMFRNCASLESVNVSNWDVSNVTIMYEMLFNCNKLATIDVSNWDTSSVTLMYFMFYNCSLLKADFAGLDINSVTTFTSFALGTNINETGTTTNYDNTLISWAAQTPQNNIVINFGTAKYSWRAIEARNTLVNTYNWTITDGGFDDVSDEFIFSVDTTVAGTSGIGNFQLPLVSSGTIDVIVDWGDGTSDNITTYNQAETLHSYSTAGEYQIKISSRVAGVNPIKGWEFNNGGDRLKMLNIYNWGDFTITLRQGFFGCTNLTQSAIDTPIVASNTISNYFRDCVNFNGNIGNWDISIVTDIRAMLFNSDAFDQDLSGWEISQITLFSDFMTSATGLSTANYDATLIGWEANLQATYPAGSGYTASININFGGSQFTLGSAAETARTSLRNTFGWTITDGGGVSGVLNQYTGAAAAYSLRNLSTATTNVVRVRRDSDNAEQDFTYDGIMDVGATGLASWVGAGNNGYVVTWYDQSGNGNHATQGTDANQPQIVASGVVITENGMPAVQFDGVNDNLIKTSSTLLYSADFSVFSTTRINSTSVISTLVQGGSSAIFTNRTLGDGGTIYRGMFIAYNGTNSGTSLDTFTNNTQSSLTWIATNQTTSSTAVVTSYVDGTGGNSFTTTSAITPTGTSIFGIGYQSTAGANYLTGSIQEIIIYPTDESSNRTNIEGNINGYYSIY